MFGRGEIENAPTYRDHLNFCIIMFFWNEATKTKDVRGHKSKVAQVAWSRLDDRKIASASYDGTAKVWTFSVR